MNTPQRVRVRAPGRVNLIGEHTDYSGGLVLPIAIELGTTIVGQRGHERVVLVSVDEPTPAEVPLDVGDPSLLEPPWARYVGGVVAELKPTAGLIGEIRTTIPIGSGLSSSAALEVAVALSLGALESDDDPATRTSVALACQRAEQRASGVPSGVMDQMASLLGQTDHAMMIDCTTLETTQVSVPDDAAIVVVDSGQRRALASSGYAERRGQVAAAEGLIGSLATASLDDVASIDDPTIRRRARHVVTENQRVRDFVAAVNAGDLEAAGDVMTESHLSMRDDFQITTFTIDRLVDHLATTPGVFGARMTGGGWGGCVVALAEPEVLDEGWTVHPSAGASVEIL